MENEFSKNFNLFSLCVMVSFGTLLSSCDKEDDDATSECFADASTVRTIQDKPAQVTVIGSKFYILEENTIDTRLRPCSLEKEFQIDNLLVTISGEVKDTPREGPCCTDNFVITQISKR